MGRAVFLSLIVIVLGTIQSPIEQITHLKNQAYAQEIGFLEEFVLADDREQVLQQLVPGTEQYYYFHALHYQNNQQLNKVDQLLKLWIKRFGVTNTVTQIRNRQALLKYSDDPQATLDYLTKQLKLNFNHQRDIPQAQRELPTKLSSDLISTERLLKRALKNRSNTGGITDGGLLLLAGRNLTQTQRRHLLERLQYPNFPGIVDLIVEELKQIDSKSFGSLKIHRALSVKQLDELATKLPRVKTLKNYVDIYLTKLHPSADSNWQSDPNQHRKYLDRLWAFVKPLNANFNSLKANVLYRKLELDRDQGKFDRSLFLEYLKLPRNASYVRRTLITEVRSRRHIVNLDENFSKQAALPPVRSDESLVRQYLHHFFVDAEDTTDFAAYIGDNYLKRQFATAKILSGVGDRERWASLLSPEQYQQIIERVDLEFLPTNSEFFELDKPVELELYTKNVKNLIVKVFEINTANYYQKYKREIDTDVNLDGLVANFEQTHRYNDAPAIRKKRKFKFDKIKRRGVYVVDFIAGGKSSRALIRLGRLQFFDQVTANGQLFTVFDQTGAVVADANLWIGGSRYYPDKTGRILIPFSTRPGRENAIITHGSFSCLQPFDHIGERYRFAAAMIVDRENLTRGAKAKVLIRPSLQIIGGNPIPVARLKNTKLTITSINIDSISTTTVIDDLVLDEKSETTCEFFVPPRLKSVSLTLSAEIENNSKTKTQSLSASQTYTVNLIDRADEIQDIHLLPTQDGYSLELLGKNGEARPKQPVRVTINVNDFKDKINVDLQTDERGLIELGGLENVGSISAKPVSGPRKSWKLNRQQQTYPLTIHANVGDSIQLPLPSGIVESRRDKIALWEIRRGHIVADLFDTIDVSKGLLQISDLAPGDYELRLSSSSRIGSRQDNVIKLRVTDGQSVGNVLVGKSRHLETRGNQTLHVASISANDKKIRIQMENVDEFTRVHVIANRYQPAFDAFATLAKIRDLEPWKRRPSLRRSVYMEGRKIGDEYEYILRRKYTQKYPGNMLQRPSLLLNPWDTKTTSNGLQNSNAGGTFGSVGNDADGKSTREGLGRTGEQNYQDFANLDFLGNASCLIANLKPRKNGVVTINRDQIGSGQHIRVIAVNAFGTVERTIELPLVDFKPRDARLAQSLDPGSHFSQAKRIEVLKKGQQFVVDDIGSAKFQAYDDLSDVYRLFLSLNPATHLSSFDFILDWPKKSKVDKQKLYSQFACHELNFFLLQRDRAFFDQVVVPHLKHKRDKTFMDLWLLGENLDSFTKPWNYDRLNVLEKILLAQRIEERSSDMVRHVNDLYALTPTSRTKFDSLYDATIRGLDLVKRDFGENYDDDSDSGVGFGLGGGGKGGGFGGGETAKSQKDLSRQVQAQKQWGPADAKKAPLGGLDGVIAGRSTSELLSKRESINGKTLPRRKRELLKRLEPSGEFAGVDVDEESKPNRRLSRERIAVLGKDGEYRYEYRRRNVEGLGYFGDSKTSIKSVDRLYRRLSPTKEWMENNYYRLLPDQQSKDLVRVNRFWRDYANHRDGSFLSPYFSEAHLTFTEMMFAMAVLGVPFEEPEQEYEYADNQMKLTANGPTIVLHQQVRESIFDRGNTTVLVSENFFQKNDRYRFESGIRFDKFVSGEFLAHVLYGSQVVLTNPTSTPRDVELLVQIPSGAVACSGTQETRTIQMSLGAFSTKTFEYAFYFPAAGNFDHFPAHVSADEKTLAVAESVTFKVIDRPTKIDTTSWEFVSQNGSEDDVIEFLNRNNVLRLNLDRIAFRMKDKTFFSKAIDTLRNRYIYNDVLWSYAIKHNQTDAIREYLAYSKPMTSSVGQSFQSDLLTIDPVDRNWYQHKEYWPLINDRAHRLGPSRKILNPSFFRQYQSLLSVLANRRQLSADDNLVVCYYLLLQDRIEQALAHFDRIDQTKLASQIQYAYCDAYLDMYRGDADAAATKAAKWVDYPVNHWRNRFKQIVAHVDEIRGAATKSVDSKNQTDQQTALASQSPSIDFSIESDIIKLQYQNTDQVTVNYYEMDIELLFSRNPFAQDNLDGFSMIRPNVSQTEKLELDDTGRGKHEFGLSAKMKNKNVLVEISAGDQTRSQPYFAHSLNVQLLEKYGQVHVTDSVTGAAIPKTYIKVYARLSNGAVRFHKDGYTDLRGRFDYVSQSNRTLDGIEKFSILILSDANGAVIKQSNPPTE